MLFGQGVAGCNRECTQRLTVFMPPDVHAFLRSG